MYSTSLIVDVPEGTNFFVVAVFGLFDIVSRFSKPQMLILSESFVGRRGRCGVFFGHGIQLWSLDLVRFSSV